MTAEAGTDTFLENCWVQAKLQAVSAAIWAQPSYSRLMSHLAAWMPAWAGLHTAHSLSSKDLSSLEKRSLLEKRHAWEL